MAKVVMNYHGLSLEPKRTVDKQPKGSVPLLIIIIVMKFIYHNNDKTCVVCMIVPYVSV